MKKIFLTLITIIFAINCSYAQWTNINGTGNYYLNSGSVGVGTTTPNYNFETVATDARTGITYPLSAVHLTTGTATDGFGTGISFGTQNYSGTPITSGSISVWHNTTNTTKMTFSTIYGYNNFVDAMTLYNGNVGIGTTSPLGVLDVRGQAVFANTDFTTSTGTGMLLTRGASSGNTYTALNSYTSGVASAGNLILQNIGGNVGIGTVTPGAKLDVENGSALVNNDALSALGGQVTISNNYGNQNGAVRLNLNNGGAVSWIKGIVTGPNTNTGSAMAFGVPAVTADGTEAMRITSNGSLAIGTTDPGSYKLAVNGTIHSKAVIIDLIGWPDYVFKKNYKLMPLAQVKSYIDQNHHLPDMPTDKEVEAKGLDVGEMNKLLTKKVEELTLYLIDQNKRIEKLEAEVAAKNK